MEITGAQISPDEGEVRRKYEQITSDLISHDISITTMESCTSGQIASLITDTEGASAIFKGAFVTYSNEAKVKAGVSEQVIERYGVYSPQTAGCMAQACREAFGADIGIGVTGSFGNVDAANADSFPGEVFFAVSVSAETLCFHCSIPFQKSRYLYKLYMADVIADVILKVIESVSASSSFRTQDSACEKYSDPRVSSISCRRQPSRCWMRRSVSMKLLQSALAARTPQVLFPQPGIPISMRLLFFVSVFI